MRVVNGSNRCNGRVELYHNGHWRRICSSDWGKEEADVLCREVNCGTPVTQAEALYFGEARDLVGVKTTCFGNETSLSQCSIQEFKESCSDATVVCTSKPFRGSKKLIHFLVNFTWLEYLLFWMTSELTCPLLSYFPPFRQ